MKFMFQGVPIRESTHTRDKNLAGQIERKRRRELEEGAAGIIPVDPPKLFGNAADEWMEFKHIDIAERTLGIHENSFQHLEPYFKGQLLTAIRPEDIKAFQKARLEAGAAKKTINLEIETLRGMLRHFGQWDRVKPKVKMLRITEDEEIGRELSAEEQEALLEACSMSRSRILYFMVVLALETGARWGTIQKLKWKWVDFHDRSLRWGKDKTPAGSGRVVPLNQRAFTTLEWWASEFPNRKPDHYVFPQEVYGGSSKKGEDPSMVVRACDPTKHIGTVKTGWRTAKQYAGWILAGRPENNKLSGVPEVKVDPLVCRFHDLRHTASSRMLKSGHAITTVAKIMGWSSSTMVAMAKRYSHCISDDLRACMESTGTAKTTAENTAQNTAHPKQKQRVVKSIKVKESVLVTQ